MRELGQSGEPSTDREPTHEPGNEQAKHRSGSFFQHSIEGDERGEKRLLTCRALAYRPCTSLPSLSRASLTSVMFCMVAGSTNILEGQGTESIDPRSGLSADNKVLWTSPGCEPHLVAAGALPDTYWARELDVDLEEWNTYLRFAGLCCF